MTDDRTAWRYYAGQVLNKIAFSTFDELMAKDHVKSAVLYANAMLAAEKERFPAPKPMTIESLNKELEELKSQQPHPLAGTANDEE